MRFLRTVHKLKNGAVHKNETTVHMFEKTHAQLFRYTGDLPGGNTFQNHGCHGREKGLFTAQIVFKEHRPEWLIPVSGYAQS